MYINLKIKLIEIFKQNLFQKCFVKSRKGFFSFFSSDASSQYQNGHGDAVPVPPGFIGRRDEQTEPVDFSTANEPVNFSGVRPVATFAGPVLAPGSGYSRESTPDSGGSHYMDAYRDTSGELY